MTRSRLTHLSALVVAAVAGGLLAAPAAAAPSAPATSESPELVVVLDSSGSMAEADAGDGQTRMDAAKQAVTDLATSTPDTTRIGLRTYGDGVDSQAPGSCDDTTLRVPVGPVDRDAITQQVQDLQPRGDTPIGTALLAAADDFTGTGPQSVVLVSDGEPTCDPDPCPVAAQLADQGIDLRIDVIGLLVDDEARTILQCIADAGGGQYVDATDATELTTALDTASERALRRYEAQGRPVSGTQTGAGAPTLAPGLWLDTFAPGETRYYAVDVPAGATAHLGATAVRDGGRAGILAGGGLLLQTSADDVRCSSSYATGGTSGVEGPVTGALAHGPYSAPAFGERDPACDDGGPVVLAVEWRADDGSDPAPVELVVLLEDPLAEGATPGEPLDEDVRVGDAPVASTTVGPVEGGGAFTTATVVGPGAHEDTVRPGETLFYRVDVGWGQQLSARVDMPLFERGTPERDALGSGPVGPWLGVELFGPGRAPVSALKDEYQVPATTFVSTVSTTQVGASTVPVLFGNRGGASPDPHVAAALAGEHYVAVTLGLSEGQAPDDVGVAIPFVLSVDVTGEVAEGPQYEAAAAAPTSSPEATEDAQATESPTTQTSVPPAVLDDAAPASGSRGPWVVALAVAAALLTATLAGLVVYGVRSTRRPRPQDGS